MNRMVLSLAVAAGILAMPALAVEQVPATAPLAVAATAKAAQLNFQLSPGSPGSRQRTWMKSPSLPGSKRAAVAASTTLRAGSSDAVAALFHTELGALTGLLPGSSMVVDDVNTAADGSTYYHLHQLYQGLRVVGEDITVQVDAQGEVQAVLGGVVPIDALDLSPALSGKTAVRTAALIAAGRDGINVPALARTAVEIEKAPVLVVAALAGASPRLAWESQIRVAASEGATVRGRVLADATTGDLLGLESATLGARMRKVWNAVGGCVYKETKFPFDADQTHVALPKTNADVDEASPASVQYIFLQAAPVIQLWDALGEVHAMFFELYGRDSFDGNGAEIRAYSQLQFDSGTGCDGGNALFNIASDVMLFGQGSETVNDFSTSVDVVFHEFGHAVTKYTSTLSSRKNSESYALNESASDFYAVLAKAWRTRTNDNFGVSFTTRPEHWRMSVGLSKQEPDRALRTLSDPAMGGGFDYYDDAIPSFASCAFINCGDDLPYRYGGIPSLALYLAANGGVHPRAKNTLRVRSPVSFPRLAKYFYHAHSTRAITENATFTQLRNALQQQARNDGMYCDESQIALAFLAVGVEGTAPADPMACYPSQRPIAPPVAQFLSWNGTGTGEVVFDGSSSYQPLDSIGLYRWDFGDGSTGYGRNITHTYLPGSYVVTLRAYDTYGRVGTKTTNITVR